MAFPFALMERYAEARGLAGSEGACYESMTLSEGFSGSCGAAAFIRAASKGVRADARL
jgi:hypothetical protein